MTAYVVTGGFDWEGESVLAVFSTEQLANTYADSLGTRSECGYDYVRVRPFEVDKEKP